MTDEKSRADTPPQPELRRDPITSAWVILAASRGKRPHAPGPEPGKDQPDEECPFCPGREERTPPEICANRDDGACDTPGWTVRTLPNKFPILTSSAGKSGVVGTLPPNLRPAMGSSEVIVDTPEHNRTPWQLGAHQVRAMLEMYRDRIQALKEESYVKYVHIIRNHKAAAASSLEHSHSQLFGLPFVPPTVDLELDGFAAAAPAGGCVLCDVIRDEEKTGDRVILSTKNFIAFSPFASRLPYESCIAPKNHETSFEKSRGLEELAEIMTDLLNRYRERLGDPPFNYWLHNYPLHGESRPYHWHIEILPRLTMAGGLELGAGVWVNTMPPEAAASFLRE